MSPLSKAMIGFLLTFALCWLLILHLNVHDLRIIGAKESPFDVTLAYIADFLPSGLSGSTINTITIIVLSIPALFTSIGVFAGVFIASEFFDNRGG